MFCHLLKILFNSVSLTKNRLRAVRFPVKLTIPPTAILYIAEDFDYVSQLKDTLHVKEVEIGRI